MRWKRSTNSAGPCRWTENASAGILKHPLIRPMTLVQDTPERWPATDATRACWSATSAASISAERGMKHVAAAGWRAGWPDITVGVPDEEDRVATEDDEDGR